MNALVYLLFITIFIGDFLTFDLALLPRIVSWAPDAVAALILMVVIVRTATRAQFSVHPKYVLWAAIMVAALVIGVVANQVQPGAIFYGLRKYFRYLPLILLPIAYPFSEAQLRGQLRVLLAFVLLQVPVAIYQRVVEYPLAFTPDVVAGTVIGSGHLSFIMLSALSVATAFYVKGRISFPGYSLLAVLLIVPTTINETTATFLLLPVAVALPFLLNKSGSVRLRRLLPLGVTGVLLFTAFVATYQVQFAKRWGGDVTGVAERAAEHLYHGATEESRADDGRELSEIGRLDGVMMPFILLDDYTQMIIGVGIGNASSSFSDLFRGEYAFATEVYAADGTTASTLVWETGALGLLLSVLFLYMVFKDGRDLSARDDFNGAFGLAIACLMSMCVVVLPYNNIITHNVVGFLMWLFAGHAIALRYRTMLADYATGRRAHTPAFAAAV